ncbi:MAG: hypothetical protein IJU65_00285 [Desulfovibrio sp.]|nr:hypothetical protein [Desulfovibrio sp.]
MLSSDSVHSVHIPLQYTPLHQRIPWPAYARDAPLNPPMTDILTAAAHPDKGYDCLRLAFCFSALPEDQCATLLHMASTVSHKLLVADFKLAERNLELPVVGISWLLLHLFYGKCVTIFRHGGLEGLVRTAGLVVEHRKTFLFGAAVLLALHHPAGTVSSSSS